MKTIDKLLYLTFILLLSISFNSIAQNDIERQKILDTLQLKTLIVDTVDKKGFVRYELDTLKTRELALTHQEFMKYFKDDMGLAQYDSLVLENTHISKPNQYGYYYKLYYKGISLFYHKIGMGGIKDIIISLIIPKEIPLDLKDLDVVPTIKKEAVLDFCHKTIDEIIVTDYYSEPELCIYANNGEGVLAYQNITYIYKHIKSYTIFIDAHTGKLLVKRRNWHDLSENCYYCSGSIAEETSDPCTLTENCACSSSTNIGSLNLPTLFYDCKTLDLTICEDNSWYQFYNISSSSKVIIISADTPPGAPAVNFCHNEQTGNLLLDYNGTMAATAYWSGTKVYDFFLAHNINGYDNMGSPINMGLYDLSTVWDDNYKILYLGDGSDGETTPAVSLDAVSHEYTHGVLNNYYKIVDNNVIEPESGGIHEGLADSCALPKFC